MFSQKAKKQPRLLNLLALFCSGQVRSRQGVPQHAHDRGPAQGLA
ncbi:Unknown protein sequence [Pseudomonas syringae pv. aceris]|nr:Unknown protein sequence [Pseudomonas syringae pv. aceris]